MITVSKQISEHFHSSEFVCQHCGAIKIDENLVNKMEHIFTKLNASKCIISSGYRCPSYDTQIGGFVGRHAEGLAADCIYYDKDGAIIPSKIVLCVAQDLGELRGMAKINDNYVHLDNRTSGKYMGDETVSNNTVTNDFYAYFGVSKADVAKYTGEVVTEGIDIFYKVKTEKNGWLPEVKNLEDYAGWEDSPIIGLAMRTDKGSLRYRATTVSGKVLGWVTGCDINDYINGWAGNNEPIATIEAEYFTPDDIVKSNGYKYLYYKVNDYPYQIDLIRDIAKGLEGYAGVKGKSITKFQAEIK